MVDQRKLQAVEARISSPQHRKKPQDKEKGAQKRGLPIAQNDSSFLKELQSETWDLSVGTTASPREGRVCVCVCVCVCVQCLTWGQMYHGAS